MLSTLHFIIFYYIFYFSMSLTPHSKKIRTYDNTISVKSNPLSKLL